MKNHNFKILLILNIAILFISSCTKTEQLYEDESFYMNTIIVQKIYGKNSLKASNEAKDKLLLLENKLSKTIENSLINSINSEAGNQNFIKLDNETNYILKKALNYSKLSNGKFDITIAPIVDLWGIGTKDANLPKKEEIDKLLKLVNYKDLILNEKGASLKQKGQSIDLGGIAKGYAGDEIIKIYKNNNINSAIINLGGNICVLGKKIDGTNWKVGIQNPRGSKNSYVGHVEIHDKCVVTSGDYERYFEKNGNRYHHILNPSTGYPSKTGLYSTTIISNSSIEGDVLSTTVFNLGLDEGMKMIESHNNTEGIFITTDKKIYLTSGLTNNFILNKDVTDYEISKKK